MSFALTTGQVLARTKLVTRRQGWLKLKVGDMVQPVRKCMGLRPGEKVERIGGPIRITGLRREVLAMMTRDLDYGIAECALEGFEHHPIYRWPSEFVTMFCNTHGNCTPHSTITRIAFIYED
mgnify:FL=1